MKGREPAAETERVRRIYDESAARYDAEIALFEKLLFQGGREWVCSQARGAVLEIGIGTGRNLAYYPADVRLIGVDMSSVMLDLAKRRARQLGRDVDLRLGDAQALDFPAGAFDTVVSTLVLCSIPDAQLAVSQAKRVLRPGGRFLLLEHVRSPLLPIRIAQRVLDPIAVRFQADHLLREPLEHLRAEGFEIVVAERLRWGIVERLAARTSSNAGRDAVSP